MRTGSLLALLLVLLPSTTQATNGAASCQVVLGPAFKGSDNMATVVTADCGDWDINDLATLHPGLGGLKVKGPPAGGMAAKCGVKETGLVCLLTFCTGMNVQLLVNVHGLNVSGIDGVLCVANSSNVWLMDGSNFSNNTVFHMGGLSSPGGSVLKITSNGTVVITKASFRGNVVYHGTVSATGSSHLTINGSEFESNMAIVGGAIDVLGHAAAVVRAVHVFNNSASAGGGIIVRDHANVELGAVHINNNSASNGGGLDISSNATIVMRACNITNNSAGTGGGLAARTNAMMSMQSCTVTSNIASNTGGGMLVQDFSHVELHAVDLTGNRAHSGGGGMIVWDYASVRLDAVTVSKNRANSGGGLAVASNATILMRSCKVTDNWVDDTGGGMLMQDYSKATLDVVNFTDNGADHGGGLAVESNATILMQYCKVTGNVAGTSGGGMLVQNSAIAMLDAVVVTGNRAKIGSGGGGGGVLVQHYANATLDVVTVSNNSADSAGGLAVIDNATILMRSCKVTGNMADNKGGGMLVQATATLYHVNITGNSANSFGGGLTAMFKATVMMHSCKVADNRAGNNGGGLMVHDLANASLNAVIIIGNRATQYGGGMFILDSAAVRLSDVHMINNSANYGGGLAVLHSAMVQMGACSATHNEASINGGGMFFMLDYATARLNSVILARNRAIFGGGLFAGNSSTVVMTTCKVTENAVWQGGAGICVQQSTQLTLDSVEVFKNRAATEGGGILANNLNGGYHKPDGQIPIKNSLVQGNIARSGAAMSIQGGNLTLGPNVTIKDNIADYEGGGVLLIGGMTDIKGNVKVFANRAGTNGAGIYWTLSQCDTIKSPRPEVVELLHYWLCPEHPHLSISLQANITKNNAGLAGGGIFIGPNIMTRTQANRDYGTFVKGNTAALAEADIYILSRDCVIGQYKKQGSDWCDKCLPGQYNIDPNNPRCQNCNDSSLCQGGAVIMSKTGFWHTGGNDNQCKLDEILRCPNADACAHDLTELAKLHPYSNGTAEAHKAQWTAYQSKQCNTGYRGAMCTVCDPRYGRTDGFSCEAGLRKIDGEVDRAGVAALIAIYFVVFTLYVLLTSLLSLYNGSHNSGEALVDHSKSAPWWTYLEFNDVSKAFVTYLQYTIGIIVKLPIAWPSTLHAAFKALTKVWGLALGSATSLDCLIPEAWDDAQAGVKAIISLGAPLATFTTAMMFHLLLWWGLAAFLRFMCTRHLHVHNTAKVPATTDASGVEMVYQSHASRVPVDCKTVVRNFLGYLTAGVWQLANIYTIQWGWHHYLEAATTFAIVAFIISGFFRYPSIMRVFIGAFICITSCGGQRYWIMDTTKLCPWDAGGRHSLAWALGFGLPAGVICLGTIVAVVTFLVHSQKKGYVQAQGGECMQRSLISRQRMFRMRYGYLYSDHKHGCFAVDGNHTPSHAYKDSSVIQQDHRCCGACSSVFHTCGTSLRALYLAWQGAKAYIYLCWDAVLHLQTLILVFISVYGQLLHEYYQVLILSFTFAAYLVLLMWLQPYHRGSQELQTISFCVMLATSFATLAFIEPVGVLGFSTGRYEAMKHGVTMVMLVINVGLIGLMVLLLLSLLFKDCKRWCHRIRGDHLAGCSSTALDAVVDPLNPACNIELT